MDNKIQIYFDKVGREEFLYVNENGKDKFEWDNIGNFLVGFINSKKESELKKEFIKAVDYIYNIYALEEIELLTPFERYYEYINSNTEENVTKYCKDISLTMGFDINKIILEKSENKELEDNRPKPNCSEKFIKHIMRVVYADYDNTSYLSKLLYIPYYYSGEIENILFISFAELCTIDNLAIKKCKNCNKYFIPVNRSDELYYSNEYKDGKTCKQIGFGQIKKKKYAEDFEKIKEDVKKIQEGVWVNEKTEADFKKWLIKVKNICKA